MEKQEIELEKCVPEAKGRKFLRKARARVRVCACVINSSEANEELNGFINRVH